MRVGVPRETAPGERRVALVPEGVRRLGARGIDVLVERGAGAAAGFATRRTRRRARRSSADWRASTAADVVVKVARAARRRRLDALREGSCSIALPPAAHRPEGVERLARARRDRVRDGVDPAHHARAVDGRALVAGTVAGYKAVVARGRPAAEALPAADDRGRHGRAGEGARPRRGRGRAFRRSRRRGGWAPSCRPSTSRPVVREQVESLGASVPRPRRARRGDRGRLRARADGRGAGAPAGRARAAASRTSTWSSRRLSFPAGRRRGSSPPRRCAACGRARWSSTSRRRRAATAS